MIYSLLLYENNTMPSKQLNQPNLLVIMADQITPFLLGAYGHDVVQTPNLNKLVAKGVRFDAAYTASPICVPARASLLTGRHCSMIGCYDNGDAFPSLTPTFAHYLTIAGYEAILGGKMHFIGPDQLHGFKQRLTTDIYPSSYDWTYDVLPEDALTVPFDFPSQYQGDGVGPGWALELQFDEETEYRGLEYIRRKHEKPFCLVTSFTSPHPPFIAPKEFWNQYNNAEIETPDFPDDMDSTYSDMDRAINRWHGVDKFQEVVSRESIARMRQGYYALLSYVDAKVGRLIDALEQQGLYEDTVIVFTGDHGDMLGEKGMIQKRSFYEWSARIPIIISGPGIPTNKQIDTPVSLIDILPTLLDLANVSDESRLPIEGRSLVPLMDGTEDGSDRLAISEYHAEGPFRACFMVRKDQYKYVFIENAKPQLFDLIEDPGEWNNLAGQSQTKAIEDELNAIIVKQFDTAGIQPEIARRLKEKRLILPAMHANGTHWDYQPFFDASKQYVRSDGTKSYLRT